MESCCLTDSGIVLAAWIVHRRRREVDLPEINSNVNEISDGDGLSQEEFGRHA